VNEHAVLRFRPPSGPALVVDPNSPVALLAARAAVTVPQTCSLADAVDVMKAEEVSSLVLEGRVGIVTERDLARAHGAGCAATDPVIAIASRHPLSVPGDTTVIAAAGLMLNEQVRHLLVELDTGGIGVVSIRDLLAVLLQALDPHLWLTSLRVAIETPSEIWLG
jgi:signal-transduction protein with cAMP-binding, CBS, and nucleotidyltransferase domain